MGGAALRAAGEMDRDAHRIASPATITAATACRDAAMALDAERPHSRLTVEALHRVGAYLQSASGLAGADRGAHDAERL